MGHPQVIAAALSLLLALTGCANLRWNLQRSLRDPGERIVDFPELVWENPDDERINVPGTISPTNWTYRVRPTVEEILAHEGLAEEVKKLL